MPVTGAAWSLTAPLTKRLCFREQIEWADRKSKKEVEVTKVEWLDVQPLDEVPA